MIATGTSYAFPSKLVHPLRSEVLKLYQVCLSSPILFNLLVSHHLHDD